MSKTLTGTVASNKGNKTIVVSIVSHRTHPIYKKKYLVTKRIMAHDETNDAEVGDKVIIAETRPISANKHFRLDKIVERAAIEHVEEEVQLTEAKAEVKEEVAAKKPVTKKPKAKPEEGAK